MSRNKNESFIALLQAATARRLRLNRTKVAKLLYLADLRAVESGSIPSPATSGAGDIMAPTTTTCSPSNVI